MFRDENTQMTGPFTDDNFGPYSWDRQFVDDEPETCPKCGQSMDDPNLVRCDDAVDYCKHGHLVYINRGDPGEVCDQCR